MRRPRFRSRGLFPGAVLASVLLGAAVVPAPGVQAAAAEPATGQPVAATSGDGHDTLAASAVDPKAATEAWLASVPPEKRERSDAYFEGGYWIALWDFLYAAAVFWILLATGASSWMRDRAESLGRVRWMQAGLYWTQFLVTWTVLQFPLSVYEGFVREHAYGLSNQTFGPWLGDFGKVLLVNVVLGALIFPVLYAVLRRVRAWWVWGSLVAVAFAMFVQLVAPVFILPLFNTFTKLEDPAIKGPILSLARANGIAVNDVFVFDASRQTTRISANVSGFMGTERISLNDNLLKRCTLPEIQAVMGHEMGHYVLHHNYEGAVFNALVIILGAVFLKVSFDGMLRRFGARWKVGGIGDLAGMPLVLLLFLTYLFAISPVINSFTRTLEAEADLFGLNASRQPDGAAEVALKLGEYRKLAPGPLEEILFFDHPSGRSRIDMAMRYKAENPAAN
ncbi:MAG TPA: M48 family metallopeptidase [Candidatus Polarisedimenticolia bacterium]|nr:M48 family metallopeptidase [Candidatus Polarisedimenticolia bacterium]